MTYCLELLKHNLCLDFLCRTTNILYIRQKQSTQEKKVAAIHERQSFLLTLQFTTEYFSTFYLMSFIFDYILVILFHSSCIHGCWVSFEFFGGGQMKLFLVEVGEIIIQQNVALISFVY